MNLYVWRSKYLQSYGEGQIIALARSVEEAREKARLEYDRHSRERFSYFYDGVGEDYDDQAQLEVHRREFEADITEEPQIVASGCLFIQGSE